MPKVSVITPVFIDIPDKIVWLDEMLQSVLSQSMQDWEVILVDDFSPILIGEVKWKYQDEKRFRWFRTADNSGPAKTRNVAVALAESDAILPLDSDDALPTNVALERMYEAWNVDRSKIVYGNLQWLEVKNGKFERSTTYVLDPYTFKNAMNLGGIIPVTAMHSVACHNTIGGWKAELEFGREDVEYIINAGKHGFCGQKIEETTLLYRKHNDSRDYKLRYEHKLEREVGDQIREMHADIFSGRFPMGCCGGNTSTVAGTSQSKGPSEMVSTVVGKTVVTYLPEGKYKPEDTWWVEYIGTKRGGRGAIFGPGRKESYNVRGTGHIFQIHKDDLEVFSKRSREYRNAEKLEYLKPQSQPEPQPQPKPIPQPQVSPEVAPELAVIERMDRKAMESRGIPIVQEQPLPEPKVVEMGIDLAVPERDYSATTQLPTDTKIVDVGETLTQASIHNLGDLDLGAFEDTLTMDSWTVELLAEAEVGDLTGYPRIGEKRAKAIIEQARKLINQT